MAYEPRLDWVDDPDAGPTKPGMTPITAEDMIRIETGIAEKAQRGEKGAKGDPGKDGAKGAKGDPGKDGFGTEAQYNDIIARLEALESPEA